MTADQVDPNRYSSDLLRAQQYRTAIPPLSSQHPQATIADAYEIQVAVLSDMLRHNDSLIGTKVSVHGGHRVFSLYTRTALLGAVEVVDLSRLVEPAAQPVLVMRLFKEVAGDHINESQIRDAIETVVAGIEVIDSRMGSLTPASPLDAIADNDAIAKILIGEHGLDISQTGDALTSLPVSFTLDGIEVGPSPRMIAEPIEAVTSLANHICGQGGVLEQGWFVVVAPLRAPAPLTVGSRVELRVGTMAPLLMRAR